jgi:TonB family protein
MLLRIAFILLSTFVGYAHAQIGDFDKSSKKYRDRFTYDGAKEEVLRTWYHYVVSRTDSGSYVLRVFYPETGQLTTQAVYADAKLQDQSGPFREWFDDGSKKSEGQVVHGKREGPWQLYLSGRLTERGAYTEGRKQGEWEEGGHARYLYDRGLRHGIYILSDSLGTDTGLYDRGKLIRRARPLAKDQLLPAFGPCAPVIDLESGIDSCSERTLMSFLVKQMRYPADPLELNIQGKALIEFVVGTDGRVTDLKVLSGVCRGIEAECLRVMKLLPKWRPGTVNEKPVKVRFTQPIVFRLR